jgi:uncharacterized protein (TIGR00369 family)
MSREELEEILSDAPFAEQYGFRIEAVESGTCTLICPSNKKFMRPDGIVSGPLLMATADAAMCIAIISNLGRDAIGTVTTEMKTNFLSAAKWDEDFWCTAKVLKTGSRLVFGTAECMAKNGRLLAHHSMTYIRPA